MGPKWLNWIVLMLSVSMVLVPAYRWYASARAYRSMPLALGVQTLKYTWAGYNKKYLRSALGGVVMLLGLLGLFGWQLPITMGIVISSLVLSAVIGLSIPPAVLLLGSSKSATALLWDELEKALYPLRVVALIDPQDAHWTVQRNIAFDNLRTKKQNHWRSIVHPLMDLSLLVVVDARVASPAVVEECIRVMQSPDRARRAIFVQADNHDRPAIDAISFDYPQPQGIDEALGLLRFVSVNNVLSIVRQSLGRW